MKTLLLALLALAAAAAALKPAPLGAAEPAAKKQLRIIVFGAHPDDSEFDAGGAAILWSKLGHAVKLVSVTNGDVGHWKQAGGPLAQRRRAEATACDKKLGAETEVLDIHDGELLPTLENRRTITRLIRQWRADIVIAPRPWDYHPDHRYVGVLVQDAAFMVTVPFFCPDVPALKGNPLFLYSSDGFQKPYPFKADIAVSLDGGVFEQKIEAIHELESQVYEGCVSGSEEYMKTVPPAGDAAARKAWLRKRWEGRQGGEANRFREALVKWYGPEQGRTIKYAEAFEICEYGRQPKDEEIRALFPFLPQGK